MRLGIGSYTYPWAVGIPGHAPARPLGADDLLARAAELGVSVLQICDNLPLGRLFDEEIDLLKRRADALGVSIEIGTRGIEPRHLEAYLGLAQRLGSPILRVVVDTADHHPSPDEVVCLLLPLMPRFAEAGVTLAIENHDRFPARVLAGIVERLGPHGGVCLDTVNSMGALEGPDVVVETLAPWTVNLHVKDFTIGRAGHQLGFVVEGRPAGQGRLDVPWVLEKVREAGRDPNAIVELWTPREPDLEKTIATEAAWAADSVAYLRGFVRE